MNLKELRKFWNFVPMPIIYFQICLIYQLQQLKFSPVTKVKGKSQKWFDSFQVNNLEKRFRMNFCFEICKKRTKNKILGGGLKQFVCVAFNAQCSVSNGMLRYTNKTCGCCAYFPHNYRQIDVIMLLHLNNKCVDFVNFIYFAIYTILWNSLIPF